LQIVLVEKGGSAPGSCDQPSRENAEVSYRSHCQTYGWMSWVSNGDMSGTTGVAKRMEAIQLNVSTPLTDGNIEYRAHCQTYGWQDWVKNGATAGTTGQGKRLEAIQIRLTGELAETYDIYYRVHCQSFGWTGWAKNGASCGSEGYAKRLEAVQVVLVKKGGSAPGSTADTFYLYEEESQTLLWGVDVSYHQGVIKWDKVAAEGVSFAMIRITKKNTTGTDATVVEDPYFRTNARGALANGIQIGGYVYNYASTPEEAKAEAELAVSLLKDYNVTFPIAFDLEEEEHIKATEKANNMAMAKAFCQVLESAGYKVYIYGSPAKLRTAFDFPSLSGQYEIWLARYRWSEKEMTLNDAATKAEVAATGYEGGNYVNLGNNIKMWQFTNYGKVNGISGYVDLDLCYKSY
jgi:GH25 family lysozyme M1 (1,4-beta-N-acetylmuramidase)